MSIGRRRFLAGLGLAISAGAGGYAAKQFLARPAAAAAPVAAAHYACPMHPHIVQGQPGSCPVCNMALVRTAGTTPAPAAAQYACPMHPHIVQPGPGTCPVCNMDLVKTAAAAQDAVHVDAATQRRMGVRLEPVRTTELARPIRAYASIAPDESAVVSVNSKVEGWIRRLHVQGVGQPVRAGQTLYELYSPELQQRQREYVDLLSRRDSMLAGAGSGAGTAMGMSGTTAAMAGSLAKERFRMRDRLIAADLPPALIDELEASRRVVDVVPVRAARSGIVTALGMREGSFVNPMQQILEYADSRRVRAEVTLFPDQLAWLRDGDELVLRSTLNRAVATRARVRLSTLQIDPQTRTATLRLPLDNTQGAFPSGAYADVEIAARGQRALTVPRDAVIRTGHGDFVVVAAGGDHFRSARVRTGIENDDAVAILSGLKEGDLVAVNGQFLLDSAATMQALQARLRAETPAEPPGHGHHAGAHP